MDIKYVEAADFGVSAFEFALNNPGSSSDWRNAATDKAAGLYWIDALLGEVFSLGRVARISAGKNVNGVAAFFEFSFVGVN